MTQPAISQDQAPTGADGMIVCDRLVRIYSGKGIEVQALQGLDLLIAEGELTALIGAAGSGKSTLMNILAGLDTPTAGAVWVAGRNLGAMTAKDRLSYRRKVAGFIWQQTSRNLLPYLTARQNVLLPMRLSSLGRREQRRRAGLLLDTLGITHCADRTPDRMSGGEQQRAAIATALANEPKLLLADEPTGELDSATAQERLAYRRSVAGFIWQQTSRNLLPYMTARQNVLLPMRLSALGRGEQRRRAGLLLDTLGIAHCADRTPDRMSGGEQQRAAIATALANQPKVLLADEPTGELDSATARDVFAALQTANTDLGATVLVVTHDSAVSSQVRRTIAMRDGKTSSETIRHSATDEQGQTTLHAREYATLDRAGRVQLPRAMTRRLGIRNRVELQEEPDHIGVWPDQAADQEGE